MSDGSHAYRVKKIHAIKKHPIRPGNIVEPEIQNEFNRLMMRRRALYNQEYANNLRDMGDVDRDCDVQNCIGFITLNH